MHVVLRHPRKHRAQGRVVAKALERFARQASVEDAVFAIALVAVDERAECTRAFAGVGHWNSRATDSELGVMIDD